MKRRTALGLLAAIPFAPAAFAQQQQVLSEVGKYLNQLTAVKGRFTQVNADGSRSAGDYYLWRPGRIRFEYDNGESLVIADGVNLAVFDARSNPPVQRYPLGQTPLRFLLQRRIDLTRDNLATGTGSANGYTTVELQDPKRPRDGKMTLVLRNSPPALTEWTVRDAGGSKTRVILDSIERVSQMDPKLFNIESEARDW